MDGDGVLASPRRIHLVAIGGKAMSAMAEILIAQGHRVSGSDAVDSAELDRLRDLGARVFVGHDAANVGDADLVACSTAVPEDNPERVEAHRLGVPVLGRPQLQGALVKTGRPVAVSGTHGKSTTTAMVVTACVGAGFDPSYLVGARMDDLGAAHHGTDPWFVVEADESDGTFLELGADIAVVGNVEADHLDQWGSIEAIEAGFDRFVAEARSIALVGVDDPIARRVGERHGSVSVGTDPAADWRVDDVVTGRGRTRFVLIDPSGARTEVTVPEPGLHNARNAALAVVTAVHMGVPLLDAAQALARYPGLERRFQVLGEAGGVTVVDDYAHNPAKVAAVLAGASDGGWGRVVAVFQPHRYSRTADLAGAFADSFTAADVLFVTELDPSGEAPRPGVSGELVADAVAEAHPGVDLRWAPDREALVDELLAELEPGDVCLTIGAGDITRLGPELLARLERR